MRGLPDVLRDIIGGRSQRSVAEALGVNEGAVSHWLSGRHAPDVATVERIVSLCEPGADLEVEVFGCFVPPIVLADAAVVEARRGGVAAHWSSSSVPTDGSPDSACPQHAATADYCADAPTEEAPLEYQPAMRAAGWVPPEERGA